jgi:hypothetical protein
MTETSYYPPTASPQPHGGTSAPGPILVAVAGPTAQRRATVALRVILAIPHFLVLYVLGIAASVVAVIGWFGALATGRLPRFAVGYLSGYLRWYCRTGAYLLLLTDEYPPFALGDAAYPARMAVSPGRLSRLSVLFRFILAIPAAIVSMLLLSGVSTIVVFIAWLTALAAGKLPVSLHQAFAAVLRYTMRYNCYVYLLTDAYPAGFFGDQAGRRAMTQPPPGGQGYGSFGGPGYAAPAQGFGPPAAGYGAQGYRAPAPGYGAPAFGYGVPDYGPPGYGPPPVPGYRAAAAGVPRQDVSWRLVLSPGARRLVGLILVLGLLTVAGGGAVAGTAVNAFVQREKKINQLNTEIARHNNAVSRYNDTAVRVHQAAGQVHNAVTRVTAAHRALITALDSPAANSDACLTVNCFNVTARPVAAAFAAFGRTLHGTPVPPGSAAVAKRLATDTAGNEQDWTKITQAASFTSIENIASAAEEVGTRFDNDYSTLSDALSQEAAKLKGEAATLDGQAATLNQETVALTRRAAALNVAVSVRTAQAP